VDTAQNRHQEAVEHATKALGAEPGGDGKLALAKALLASGGPTSVADARRLADAAWAEKPNEHAAGIRAQIALVEKNVTELKSAVSELQRLAPDGVSANYFGALLSLLLDEPRAADAQLTKAERAGLPAQVAAQLREQTGLSRYMRLWHVAEGAGYTLIAWLVGLIALYGFGRALSRFTLSAIEAAAGDPDELRRRTQPLRGTYRALIVVAALYYYLSIPVVIGIVVAGAGGIVYGLLVIGYIPVKLLALVAIGALFSIWAILKSLVASRGQAEEPGRKLLESEAPALWAMLREIAGRLGTRPVDTVYLTAGTDVAVAERGPLRARLADRSERHLILGIGVLSGFSQSSLRAVLAHEYGHFSNRDTAGGRLAGAVLGALFRTVINLAERGGLLVLNPVWHFLRGFHALFLRITLGASRLQEVLADQCAALAFGPRAFSEGLTHVIRRSVAFERASELLAGRAEKERQPLASLYELPPGLEISASDIEDAVAKAMTETGSPYESHPPPGLRLKWVARLPEPPATAPESEDAWSLFVDRAALEKAMTDRVNQQLRDAGIIGAPAAA
jgi:Zn-dependent protease with chaperone function